jgi:hypothetical protein
MLARSTTLIAFNLSGTPAFNAFLKTLSAAFFALLFALLPSSSARTALQAALALAAIAFNRPGPTALRALD